MHAIARSLSRLSLLAALVAAPFALAQDNTADPPSRVGRLSVLDGNVSLQPASVNDFSPAEINYPLTTGDRLYTDNGARAELEAGQLTLRLGAQTDFTVTALTDTLAQFGLAQGSVHLRPYTFDPAMPVELDTPNASLLVRQPGDFRVDVYPQEDVSVFTVLSGEAEVDADGVQQIVRAGQALEITGASTASVQFVGRMRADALDTFSAQRDQQYQQELASEQQYVDPATIGYGDLGGYGDWSQDADYGAVWYPRNVAADWAPYRAGHWAWIAPWGWTWVESEPWGFAPFHYGRWVRSGPRWGWIPGPPAIHPIYSPALVVFVGGPSFSVGVGVGPVTAWFPLGPREVYQPWYHASPVYVNRVNVTNIYNRNTVEVRNIYNARTVVYNAPRPNAQFVNRTVATTAMPQDKFASGRAVAQNRTMVDPNRFAGAPVLPHPLVSPQRAIVAPAPARALPPVQARPVLAQRGEGGRPPASFRGGGSQPGSPTSPTSIARPIPAQSGPLPVNGGEPNQPRPTRQPVAPPDAGRAVPSQPAPSRPAPVQQAPSQPVASPPANPPQQFGRPLPARTGPVPVQNAPTQPAQTTVPARPVQQPVQRPFDQPQPQRQPEARTPDQRPLVNQNVPPAPRPSFDQQRQAIEQQDPGRPLAPQQLDNLRNNRPSGPPPQREAAPHPVPAPRPAPPAKPAPPASKDDHKH